MSRVGTKGICSLAVLAAASVLLEVARAEGPPEANYADELPRIPPIEPHDALQSFVMQPGFRIEQVAAEPLVADPVAMSFDADARLYVVEMRGYSEQPDELLSRVRLLEDTDADGRFDKSTLFLDQLSWPTAVTCYDGGVFIADAPDILYCRDHDSDGRADERRVVFTGFGKTNVQGLVNTFTWGLDNRIHGATSSSGGEVRRPDQPETAAVGLGGRDFAFDPRTLQLHATSGGGQHGMSFDAWGRKFVCSNSDHVQQVMFEESYLARNPLLAVPSPRISIAADGPQAEVFRVSPVEPWRIVRTRLRVAGTVPGIVEGGGRPAGYFTGATGITIYRGDAWPAELGGTVVVGDVGSNLVHRKRLEPNGLEFVARRIDEGSELVASHDIWFRPAQFANAPDGTLYIADVYREVIEHPDSLPPVIKRHLDLTSGRDRGRIYRIAPEGFEQTRPRPVKLSGASTGELVELLEHANGWHRETASRLLYERHDRSAIGPLEALSAGSKSPLGRMHALWALAGLDALSAEVVLRALGDPHPRVREHAVRLAERFAGDSSEVRERLYDLADDHDLHVRYQVAFSLGEIDEPERVDALARIARRDAGDPWVQLAILSSLASRGDELLAELAGDETFRRQAVGRQFLSKVARQAGLTNRPAEVGAVLRVVQGLSDDEAELAQSLIRGLGEGLVQRGSSLEQVLPANTADGARQALDKMLATASQTAMDESRPPGERAEALGALALAPFQESRDLVASLLDHRQPHAVQAAALGALARQDHEDVASIILDAWPGLSPALRSEAAEVLFARAERLLLLLEAIESAQVSAADLDPSRLRLLAQHANLDVRAKAAPLLERLETGRRREVVESYRASLALPGELQRGKLAFEKLCAACHKLEGVGHEIGPNLATLQNRGAEAILINVLDPSREVNPQYVNYVLTTTDGLAMTGMIAAETANSVTLKRAEAATDVVLRVDIDELSSTGLSLMPEGFEQQLDPQAMADLIAYLMSL